MGVEGKETSIRANERSEGGELITYMNLIFSKKQWGLKEAVGELSLRSNMENDDRNSTLFPDIIVFHDTLGLIPVMGWELKMPDVAIDDSEFYNNAKDKANRMGTSAFVLWNFQYCRVFYREKNGEWSKKPSREYNDYSEILRNRKYVHENKDLWKAKVYKVLRDLNSDMIDNLYKVAPVQFNIATYVDTISSKLAPLTAEYLLTLKDPQLGSKMRDFVREEQAELTSVDEKSLSGIGGAKVAALAYSKNIIIRWINRLLFCNLLRFTRDDLSKVLFDFIRSEDLVTFKRRVNDLILKTDFYSILHVNDDEVKLPKSVISNLSEFCSYLWNIKLESADSDFTSEMLEEIVVQTKRELMGLYTTPKNLAKLLVKLSMKTVKGDFADFTVGSGTIIREVIQELRQYESIENIHKHVWASDKYQYPLQIANFSMTSNDSLNQKNIIFQHNALSLEPGQKIGVVNPMTGKKEVLELPKMTLIVSNLPFVNSNNRSEDDKKILRERGLNGRYDLYQGLILHYKSLLEKSENARIGIITSNSWFKNQKKDSFFKVLNDNFSVETIVYSNVARWFNNADVVATILVLAPKGMVHEKISLISLNLDIRKYSVGKISELADQIIVNRKSESYDRYEYDSDDIIELLKTGICMEALFDDLSWYKKVLGTDVLRPLVDVCDIRRGTRTGADKIFITDGIKTDLEDSHPYVKTLKGVSSYEIGPTNQFFFYTALTMDELRRKGHYKTIDYINDIDTRSDSNRMKAKHGKKWYVAEDAPKYGDFVTSINPNKRLFWASFKVPMALNQRVIAASLKKKYEGRKELVHALLNSIIPIFILCGSGFVRAEGVTDITKDGLEKLYILDPDKVSEDMEQSILNIWKVVKNKNIVDIISQLNDPDWIKFNILVLKAYGLDRETYKRAKYSIELLINRRQRISKSV